MKPSAWSLLPALLAGIAAVGGGRTPAAGESATTPQSFWGIPSRKIEVSANVQVTAEDPAAYYVEPTLVVNPADPQNLVAASMVKKADNYSMAVFS